jgi:hypothetical protein
VAAGAPARLGAKRRVVELLMETLRAIVARLYQDLENVSRDHPEV